MRSLVLLGLVACSSVACSSTSAPAPEPLPGDPDGWGPDDVVASDPEAAPRAWLDVRGLIHAHSVYSHDACDNEPREGDENTGPINEACFEDFRRDMCAVGHDYIMLSDHRTSFGHTEFPEVLLFRPDRGDVLLDHGSVPSANRAACPDGTSVLILAGSEAGTMPVGLEGHVSDDIATRQDLYGEVSAEAVATHKAQGAVALVAHTEEWTPEQLIDLGLDGFEMYNVHANLIVNVAALLELLPKLATPEELPHPDLVVMPAITESESYLSTWGTVLARDARRVTTMGTDCHRNSFPQLLEDGERVDSYRRMMKWFSNHLLVTEDWDDRDLKDALRSGRLYGSFDIFGYPQGFDYHAVSNGVHEMGSEVSLADGVELVVAMPAVANLSTETDPPELTARILRAVEGGWTEVASGAEDLSIAVDEPGAYRAEIRIRPRHLAYYLRSYAHLAEADYAWVYSNAIYVVP